MVASLSGELAPEPGELFSRLFEAGGGLARLLFCARGTDLQLDCGLGKVGELVLGSLGSLGALVGRAKHTGKALAQRVELGCGPLHLGGVGGPLRLKQRLGACDVCVVQEELLFEFGAGTLECPGQFLCNSCQLAAFPCERLERLLPLPSLARQTFVRGRGLPRAISRRLLGPENLGGRLGTDRRDEGVVTRRDTLCVVERGQRVGEEHSHVVDRAISARRRRHCAHGRHT